MCSTTTEALRSVRVEDGGSHLGTCAVLRNTCSRGIVKCVPMVVLSVVPLLY